MNKMKPKKLNLHTLAAELAKADNPNGKNIDVIDAQIILQGLGRKLRRSAVPEALDILNALAGRAGK